MQKTHLKFCFYKQCNHHQKKMRFLYINGFNLETCHIMYE